MDNDSEGKPPNDEERSSEPQYGGAAAPESPSRKSRSGRRFIPFALLGVMTVGTGIAAYFAVRDNTTPSEALSSALTNSLKFKSAAITTAIGVSESQGTATITSKGATDFDNGSSNQVMQIAGGGQQIGEHIISDRSTIYVHIDGGAIARVVAGKSWVSVPNGQSAANSSIVGGGGGNSTAILRVLSVPGHDVSDLGLSRVNADVVHLYAVHLSRSEINRDLAREHLPQSMRQAIGLIHIPSVTYTVAIDGANRLTELKTTLHVQIAGQHVTEHVAESYSHYGTRVSAIAPPSHEVVPFQRYLQLAQGRGENVTI
jgi:hypothetical protein